MQNHSVCRLPTAYCLLPTAYCLLPTAQSATRRARVPHRGVIVVFLVIAPLAGSQARGPARRASRVDLVVALRAE